MRIVVALGGNALLKRGEPLTAENQRRNLREVAPALAGIAAEHQLILVHGNGPQVGLLALEADAYKEAPPMPLDVLSAESQGMIGYVIQQELKRAQPKSQFVTVLTQTVVAADDPAFGKPSKPIGPIYDEAAAKALAKSEGWDIAKDGAYFRRVVASPEPLEIVELPAIRDLLADAMTPICCGGGGVPVTRDNEGRLTGVEAVIDKDLAAAKLGIALDADRLVILTDVEGVFADWGTPNARLLTEIDAKTCDPSSFASGSMGPKVKAACRFALAAKASVTIGALDQAEAVLAGTSGTTIAAAS
ncbi:carbamate kinase [Methyloligella sp. 2.7D]|uniref:carbamate kinase n=1 Tax=unclassified Methyloligella TaxID=2625955 RepID=UPI00157E0D68|nr:carbamate kinase [Methyloligella sp. GL2]QKP77439.1 carbamate kinase [Methyloligella sp. GL2]